MTKKERLTAIDLCCGAGGWTVAAKGLPIDFVAVVDWNKDCLETWRINHRRDNPNCKPLLLDLSQPDSVKEILEALPNRNEVDIVLGGIPCEQVSIMRSNIPLPDQEKRTLHGLIDQCFHVVSKVKPTFWCMEDVLQIVPHLPLPIEGGPMFEVRKINAADFGPQSRKRVFIGNFPSPKPMNSGVCGKLGDCLLPGPYRTVPRAERLNAVSSCSVKDFGKDDTRILDPSAKSPTIITTIEQGGDRNRRLFMVKDRHGIARILSWQECARIQGFPEDYLFVGSMKATYKMIGQAIDCRVGYAILNEIVLEYCRNHLYPVRG